MKALGAAVIGLGFGKRHLVEYSQREDVEVRALCVGSNQEKLKEVQAQFNVDFATTDYREVLDQDDIDIVSICSPDHLHAEQCLDALEKGKHVLVEKPLATTKKEAASIVNAVRSSGLKLMVGQNYRFIPMFKTLRDIAVSGQLGDVYLLEGDYIQEGWGMVEGGPEHWRMKTPQDFFIGGAVHQVDFLRWIGGEVQEVHSFSNHRLPVYPLDENYVTSLKFESGCIGRILLTLSCRIRPSFQVRFAAYGTAGFASAVNFEGKIRLYIESMAHGQNDTATVPVDIGNSLQAEIDHFVDCVKNDKAPLIGAAEGAATVAVCVDSVLSAKEGKSIVVDM